MILRIAYQDDSGLFADFHSNRHTFITSLERAGVSPRTAQSLARHCDIRLTMGVYTHIGLHDQTRAIGALPAPPRDSNDGNTTSAVLQKTGTDDSADQRTMAEIAKREVPTMVPSGAKNGAIRLASLGDEVAPNCTPTSRKSRGAKKNPVALTWRRGRQLRTNSHPAAPDCIAKGDGKSGAHSEGVEPPTYGSEVHCSIQLSYECFAGRDSVAGTADPPHLAGGDSDVAALIAKWEFRLPTLPR